MKIEKQRKISRNILARRLKKIIVTNKEKDTGITLISLVITIIILLILAGISILSLTGSGLFGKAKEAREKTIKVQYEEELNLTIDAIITDAMYEIANFDMNYIIKKLPEYLEKEGKDNFIWDSNQSLEEPKGEYKGYSFYIDKNYNAHIGEAIGTLITYVTTPEGYTNKDEVKILLEITNKDGIKTVQYPNGSVLEANGQKKVEVEYLVTKNGTYSFRIIDNKNKELEKNIVVQQIDKENPKYAQISIDEVKSTSLKIKVNSEDREETEESVKSGIERFEYYIGEFKYDSTESNYICMNLSRDTQYEIYVIVYDKAGNSVKSNIETITTMSRDYPILKVDRFVAGENAIDLLNSEAYDKNFTTYQIAYGGVGTRYKSFKIDSECWGKYLTIYSNSNLGTLSLGTSFAGTDVYYGALKSIVGNECSEYCAKSILIPEGTYWAMLSSGGDTYPALNICEVWCSEEDLTGRVY